MVANCGNRSNSEVDSELNTSLVQSVFRRSLMTIVATSTNTPSAVVSTPAAPALQAMAHFAAKLAFETDCADVFSAFTAGADDFILLDVRSETAFLQQHATGAQNLPHRYISAERMALFPTGKTFVVYCAGPHCNGADQAAYKIATLGYPVKLMIGGITGWADEGLPFTQGHPSQSTAQPTASQPSQQCGC
jgi:rhodanese-related sulfurtransferase